MHDFFITIKAYKLKFAKIFTKVRDSTSMLNIGVWETVNVF